MAAVGTRSPDPPSSKNPHTSRPALPGQPAMPQMTPIRNPHRDHTHSSSPAHPGHPLMPQMTPIRNPIDDDDSSFDTAPMHPISALPSPLGKPPPHIHSQAPTITPQPQRPFGKLVITIVKGLNLKAGQGVFGRADPYVKLKLGDAEFSTNPHKSGGKNPVSISATLSRCLAI